MKKRLSYICALSLALSALTACSDNSGTASNPEFELDAGIDVTQDAGTDVTQDAGTDDKPTLKELSDAMVSGYAKIIQLEFDCMAMSASGIFTEEAKPQVKDSMSVGLAMTYSMMDKAFQAIQKSQDEGRILANEALVRCLDASGFIALLQKLAEEKTPEDQCAAFVHYMTDPESAFFNASEPWNQCIDNDGDFGFHTPTVADGGACSLSVECLSGRCLKQEGTCNGQCIPKSKKGEPCSEDSDACEAGLTCTSEGICDVQRSVRGGSCTQTSDCAEGLECAYKASYSEKICAQPKGEGEGCAEDAHCGGELLCHFIKGESQGQCKAPIQGNADCSHIVDGSPYCCEEEFICQRTGGTSSTPVKTCVSLKGVGEACALEVDTYNNTCRKGEAFRCSPEGVCLSSDDVRAEGEVCKIDHEDGKTTEYTCENGYKCSDVTHQCVKKAVVGETCMNHRDCFDVVTDPLISMSYNPSDSAFVPYPTKKGTQAPQVDPSQPLLSITSVRCVADALENRRICQEVKDVGGACMAKFSSPESGCKLDLICMPNESGADENGFTGKCQRAPGLNETCATHEAYEGYLCDAVTSAPTMTTTTPGEVSCICGPKKAQGAACNGSNECSSGLVCSEATCISLDMLVPESMGCTIADQGLDGILSN